MTPFYDKSGIQIYNADCLEVLKGMPDKSVDLVLTDPPYGIELGYDGYNDTANNLKELVGKLMPELLRVGKRVAITPGVQNVWLYPPAVWMMAWIYGTTNTYGAWGFNSWQPILCYGKDAYLEANKGARQDIIKDSHIPEKSDHPCPKSIDFWSKLLLRTSVNESDLILDPFLGSGTTCVAAKQLKRRCIGIEISEKYCKIAADRVDRAQVPML